MNKTSRIPYHRSPQNILPPEELLWLKMHKITKTFDHVLERHGRQFKCATTSEQTSAVWSFWSMTFLLWMVSAARYHLSPMHAPYNERNSCTRPLTFLKLHHCQCVTSYYAGRIEEKAQFNGVWCPSVCLSRPHTHRDSPGSSMRHGQCTF